MVGHLLFQQRRVGRCSLYGLGCVRVTFAWLKQAKRFYPDKATAGVAGRINFKTRMVDPSNSGDWLHLKSPPFDVGSGYAAKK